MDNANQGEKTTHDRLLSRSRADNDRVLPDTRKNQQTTHESVNTLTTGPTEATGEAECHIAAAPSKATEDELVFESAKGRYLAPKRKQRLDDQNKDETWDTEHNADTPLPREETSVSRNTTSFTLYPTEESYADASSPHENVKQIKNNAQQLLFSFEEQKSTLSYERLEHHETMRNLQLALKESLAKNSQLQEQVYYLIEANDEINERLEQALNANTGNSKLNGSEPELSTPQDILDIETKLASLKREIFKLEQSKLKLGNTRPQIGVPLPEVAKLHRVSPKGRAIEVRTFPGDDTLKKPTPEQSQILSPRRLRSRQYRASYNDDALAKLRLENDVLKKNENANNSEISNLRVENDNLKSQANDKDSIISNLQLENNELKSRILEIEKELRQINQDLKLKQNELINSKKIHEIYKQTASSQERILRKRYNDLMSAYNKLKRAFALENHRQASPSI